MFTNNEVLPSASADKQLSVEHDLPVHVEASAFTTGCNNSPGPEITLVGEISLGEIDAQIIFKNNAKGTHQAEVDTTVDVIILPDGEVISFPKQPVLGGVGGNPFIWLQFVDENGEPLSEELFLGRCVQGFNEISADFFIPSTVTAVVSAESCKNSPGPFVTLEGEVAITGIDAKLIFRNNDNPVGGPHEHDEDTTVDIIILPAGESITIPKQPPLGGAGGNPIISVVFLDEDGDTIGDEFELGRCKKI